MQDQNILDYYVTTLCNILYFVTTLYNILYYVTTLYNILYYVTTLYNILYYKTVANIKHFTFKHPIYCIIKPLQILNTRRMSQTYTESIFTKIIYEIVWSYETIMCIIKIKCFYPPRILDEHRCIYSCLQIPPRENRFQYVRRVYATAINFPCICTLSEVSFITKKFIS